MDVRELRIRREVEDLRYEPAVDLGDVVKGTAPEFVADPIAFFERTHLTDSMKALIIKSIMNLLGLKSVSVGERRYDVSSNLILLPSDLGGGKTHALILLYHIFNLISTAQSVEDATKKLRVLSEDIADFVSEYWADIRRISPKIVVMDCKYSDLAPSPIRPIEIAGKRIKTLWGYLGYELGKYDLVRRADERETAPYADDIFKVLNRSRALILVDEIGRYYDQSGLEPTRISVFLMNLAEVMSKYNISEVSVVISIPYEVKEKKAEAKAGMEYVHSPELIKAINEVLSRPAIEIIKPVERQDLAEILRKRIFDQSREELERLVEEFITRELGKGYPSQVVKVLDDRGFWKVVRSTYPFHPMFLDVLEKLAYKLPYLQRTRDAIKIAVQTVLVVKEGLFDWLEDGIDLIMPYHIPLFIGEILDETILRNAPGEYKVFQLILRNNVVEQENFGNLRRMRREEFYERIVTRALRDLKTEDIGLGVKLASIIWLHSLIGLGLPMNMGDFPTTTDLIYSVSPTELDVKGVLGILRSVLPQLFVHGDPESDTARWFFASIPSIEELVEILKKNVTDEMAKNRLTELLEWGLTGKRGKGRPPKGYRTDSIFKENVVVIRTTKEVPKEVLESNDPSLVIAVDIIPQEDLVDLLRGRNNVVVLAPYVEGFDEIEKLSPEDIKGIRELSGFRDKSVWDGLLEILRYYVAIESITEAHLMSFVGKKISGSEEEYKLLVEDIMKLLRGKVESKKDYFYRHTWNLINRCYRKVYYYRLGNIRSEEGLTLESDRPIPPIVEEFLRERELIPLEFKRDNILSIFRDYLGKDPKKDVINIGALWNFIRSTDKANVPLINYKMYINAIKDLIKTLDYAVVIKGIKLWKPVFNSKDEAERGDEGRTLLDRISDHIRKTGVLWNDLELIYWENIFDEWREEVIKRTPREMVLKLIDRRGNVLDIRDIKFDPKSTIKAGKLFYEKRKYIVDIETKLPDEIWERREYEGVIEVNVENFDEELTVELRPDSGLLVKPSEFKGRSPLRRKLVLRAERAGDYMVNIEVYGRGELLERRSLSLPVRGEWKEREVKGEEVFIREGGMVASMETTEFSGIPDIIRVTKKYGGIIEGSFKLQGINERIELRIQTRETRTLELLWSTLYSLIRSMREKEVEIYTKLTFEKEPELKDLRSLLTHPKLFRFIIKERALGG